MIAWDSKLITLNNGLYFSAIHHLGTNNKTILFLHGLGSAKEDFSVAINYPKLRNYNLLAIDLVGHGNSIKPLNFSYTMEEQARSVFLLLQELSYTKNLIIVAHSMAGPIAILLAELLTSKPLAMVYAEGNIDFGDCFGSNMIISSGSLEDWEEKKFFETLQELKKEDDYEISNYAVNFEKAGAKTTYLSSLDLVRISKEDILIHKLVQLNIPVLPLFGEKNKGLFPSEKKIEQYFHIKFISNAGHDMMLANPDEFYQFIEEFISNLD